MQEVPVNGDVGVAIIGAGFGGIGMALRLQELGLRSWCVLEAAEGPGGVWRDNTYPGAACDVPSHLYSYSFAQPHWSRRYSGQAEILRYLGDLVDKRGLSSRFRYNSRVEALDFDEESGCWLLELADGSTLAARVVVSAVGQLNRPAYPDVPGTDSFVGPTWHSSRWDGRVQLEGKAVAVIGTGTSALQFVPEIAKVARRIDLYQRSAPYVLPKQDRSYAGLEGWAYRRLPILERADRLRIFLTGEALTAGYVGNRRVAERVTAQWRSYLESEIPEPALRAAATPDYRVGCKRIGFSSEWYPTLRRPNVELITDPVTALSATGVVTGTTCRDVDALIWATGFKATELLGSMVVTGRGGTRLGDQWRDGAEAYQGVAVAGFPNLFLLYGPNTNVGASSVVYMLEALIGYVSQALELLGRENLAWMDVRAEVQGRYNAWVQRASAGTAYQSGCHSWYTNPSGRNTNNWPTFTLRYRRRLRRLRSSDYELRQQPPGGAGVPGPIDGLSTAPTSAERFTVPRCTTYQTPRHEISEAIPRERITPPCW